MHSLYFTLTSTLLVGLNAAALPGPKKLASRAVNASDTYANWPTYDQLPLNSSYPTKAAWGVWGENDTYGALNHITNATILAAKNEIRLGKAINLNLQLDLPDPPTNPNRRPLIHLFQPGDGYTDDVVTLNTQTSTQYDGLRHFPYSTNNSADTYQWYNDLIADYDEVIGNAPTTVLGVQEAAQYGIAGRGVLLDWAGWAESRNMTYDPFSARRITVDELDATATWQGLNASGWSLPGDILLVRTGFTEGYRGLNSTQQWNAPFASGTIGIDAGDQSAEWIWDKKLAMVGADNPAFESIPFAGNFSGDSRSLHQIFIGGWGQSIVELLDLETLATTLHQHNRSTFFMTIQNLNIISGIASPPNAMAIL